MKLLVFLFMLNALPAMLLAQTMLTRSDLECLRTEMVDLDNGSVSENFFTSDGKSVTIFITEKVCVPCLPKLEGIIQDKFGPLEIRYLMVLRESPLEIDLAIRKVMKAVKEKRAFHFVYRNDREFLCWVDLNSPSPFFIYNNPSGVAQLYDFSLVSDWLEKGVGE